MPLLRLATLVDEIVNIALPLLTGENDVVLRVVLGLEVLSHRQVDVEARPEDVPELPDRVDAKALLEVEGGQIFDFVVEFLFAVGGQWGENALRWLDLAVEWLRQLWLFRVFNPAGGFANFHSLLFFLYSDLLRLLALIVVLALPVSLKHVWIKLT